MKAQQQRSKGAKMGSSPFQGNGVVLAVIFRRTSYHPLTAAGVKKSWNRGPYQACRRTHAVKRVESTTYFPRNVHIRASSCVMQDHVPRALTSVQRRAATVERSHTPGNVLKPITILDGAVARSAEI